MVVLVQKYGGSSLTDLSKLEFIAKKVKDHVKAGYKVVVVLSAMQGETDRLLELSKYMNQNTQPRECDALLATGEQITTSMMAMALQRMGTPARSLNAEQAGIYCDGKFTRAAVTHIDASAVKRLLDQNIVPVITGFQGMCEDGSVATLGRGGSDLTAVAVAAAIGANECQIFVDVHGVYTADPKVVQNARLIHTIPVSLMTQAAMLGAKVIQKRAVICAHRHKVPVRICSTYREGPGTMLELQESKETLEQTKVFALTHQYHQIMLELSGFTEDSVLSFIAKLNQSGLELEHSIKPCSAQQFELSMTMADTDYQLFTEIMNDWREVHGVMISEKIIKNKARVSLVGQLLSRDLQITSKLLSVCQRDSIHIWHLIADDTKVSVLVDHARVELLLRSLHRCFIEKNIEQQNCDRAPEASRVIAG